MGLKTIFEYLKWYYQTVTLGPEFMAMYLQVNSFVTLGKSIIFRFLNHKMKAIYYIIFV